jgi:DNA-binding beta-propeller fold protein YncE
VAALSLAGLVLLLATATALAVTGDLTQPAGAAGCVSETGVGPCADGRALAEATAVAVSPDGEDVYVASYQSSAVAHFVRNPTTGAISQPTGQAGCISVPDVQPGAEPCADGHGLGAPTGLAVSPDGKSVYVTSWDGTVARLNRNTTTGGISQPAGPAGCISEDGSWDCADGHALGYFPTGVAVSPDNKSVYVASLDGGVVRLNRNTSTGAISQPAGTAGCVSEEGVGPCQNGHAIDGAWSVVVSPDAKHVYVASFLSDAVTRFNRNTTTGAIVQPAGNCISESGTGGCDSGDGHGLNGAQGLSVSPDGKSLYVGSENSHAVARINRRPDGSINQPLGPKGCINENGSDDCTNGHGLSGDGFFTTAVAPGGGSVYATSGVNGSVLRFNRAP